MENLLLIGVPILKHIMIVLKGSKQEVGKVTALSKNGGK